MRTSKVTGISFMPADFADIAFIQDHFRGRGTRLDRTHVVRLALKTLARDIRADEVRAVRG